MKKLVRLFVIVLELAIAALVFVGIYTLYSAAYPNWTIEKKQAYQFMLLERKLRSNPERCNKVTVITQRLNYQSDFDTIRAEEVEKLSSYPTLFRTEIIIPFKEFGDNYRLCLTKRDSGKIAARIVRPLIYPEIINFPWGSATIYHKIGVQEYPYAQGKREEGNFIFEEVPDKEYARLTLQALEKANKILRDI